MPDGSSRLAARPPVKIPGGKRKLAAQICAHMPAQINRYVEPFCGGAAVFFHLYNEGRLGGATVRLSDANPELVSVFRAIRDEPASLIAHLREHAGRYDRKGKDYYLAVRSQDPREWNDHARIGGRFIFLNRTCFNGVIRYNRSGLFNVPHGTHARPPVICNAENIMLCSHALARVVIACEDFQPVLDFERRTSDTCHVTYLDPPYAPLSDTSDFTTYCKDGFTKDHQTALANQAKQLALATHPNGGRVICSNSSAPLVRDLYADGPFTIHEIMAARSVNSKTDKRGVIKELLMVSA